AVGRCQAPSLPLVVLQVSDKGVYESENQIDKVQCVFSRCLEKVRAKLVTRVAVPVGELENSFLTCERFVELKPPPIGVVANHAPVVSRITPVAKCVMPQMDYLDAKSLRQILELEDIFLPLFFLLFLSFREQVQYRHGVLPIA